MKLLSELLNKQNQEGLSDRKFAMKLKLDRRLYGRTVRGEVAVGIMLLQAIARTYPDMDAEVMEFLRDGKR